MCHTRVAMGMLVLLAAGPGCKKQPPPPVAATPIQQASALQLGFAAGSFLAQDTQTLELRKQPVAGFARSEDDLYTFMARLGISETDAASAVSAMLDGFADPNPRRGSELLSQGINLVMSYVANGPSPELLRVFKVGITVGHMIEVADVLTRGAPPQQEEVAAFMALTARNRATLQEDLDQAGLPQELVEAVQATNVEARTVTEMIRVTQDCLKVRSLAAKLQ